jgi:uncharacterized protein (TIGR02302 family)
MASGHLTPTTPPAARRAVRLTLLGLWAERLLISYWPLLSVLSVSIAIFLFGLDRALPLEAWWVLVLAIGFGTFAAFAWGWRQFSRPRWADARSRVDLTLPGRPLAAIADAQALGQTDDASRALWETHQKRMAERAALAEAVEPDVRISRRDPYALRHLAALALFAALIFGGAVRLGQSGALASGAPLANPGPSWEAWIDPPAYTGKPGIYLVDIEPGALAIPEGSRITVRLYGDDPDPVTHTLTGSEVTSAEKNQDFVVTSDGLLEIGDDAWNVTLIGDMPPTIKPDGEAERSAKGEMKLKFVAADDYGVVAATATMTLDLDAIERRYGLALDPEVTEPIVVDLALPIAGNRKDVKGALKDDFSKHPWSGLPVTLTLSALDEASQEGVSPGQTITLEGRRFFDPMASAVAEQRRDLIWNRENGPRIAQVLRAMSWNAQDILPSASVYLRLRRVIFDLETGLAAGRLADQLRDDLADELWEIALDIEEGQLADALARLRKAQEKLAEAIENGASPDEISELTQEMREAMKDYMQQLAENGEQPDPSQMENSQTITQDQLNQMLQELQKLMEEGRQEEAQALLDQLMQMMENMTVTQGEGGEGEGQQAMKGLGDTLKEQQDLSDETFRDLQEGQNGQQGQQPRGSEQQGQQGQPGQEPGEQNGQGGQDGQSGQGGMDAQSLAERQEALREMLNEQAARVPGLGGQQGEELRRSLDEAGDAMDRAEESLRNEDLAGALDNQAEAMERLREGMRDLGEMLAEQNEGQGRQGDADGQADAEGARDPLGREQGATGRIGTDQRLLQGEDVYRRARELLDEIRRRSSERERPGFELDYLRRLLEQF